MSDNHKSSSLLKKSEKESPNGAGSSSEKKTTRLELELFEPDEYKFPEFNFKKLIAIEKAKQKKLAKKLSNGSMLTNNDDPLGRGGDGDDDVARIAREMEAKYGSGSSYGKSNVKDVDRGVGYDNNDSFIDDTDAYDEFIPDEYIPDRGGFYVNSGLLEFKKIPNFERPGDENRMPKARKRALSTSSESEGEDQNKKSANSSDVASVKKKNINKEKKAKSSITASSSSDEQGKAAKKAKKMNPIPESLPPIKEQDTNKEKKIPLVAEADNKKEVKITTVKDMLRTKRDYMRKMEQDKEGVPIITIDADDGSESNSLADSIDSPNETNTAQTVTATKSNGQSPELSLPSNFSPELCQSIISLKDYVQKTVSLNTNFYDNHVKEQLIKIDDLGKLHDTSTQVQVYKQLETFIPTSKKAILSKVNRFRIQHAESKLKSQIKKLKSAINRTLPDLVKKYDEDLKDYEGKKNLGHINPFEQKAPRRKFRWDDNLRQLLTDTVQLIMELHKVSKSKKDPIEEFKTSYLKTIVLPLWPEEWIKFDDLRKELERKERGAAPQSHLLSQNGKYASPQKTETPAVHEKSPSPSLLQKQQQISVIKKSSDHSISSIMSSPSPPPPSIQSHPVVNASQLKAKIIQLSEPKTPEKRHRISDGSDSDCAIIESPRQVTAAATPTVVPISKSPDSHQIPVSNIKQQNDIKKAKEADDYSNLINSFNLLTGKKESTSPSINNTVSSSSQDRNLTVNTSHDKSNGF